MAKSLQSGNMHHIVNNIARNGWKSTLIIGSAIVLFSLLYGVYNSFIVSDYLSNAKITREAAGTGSILAQQKSFIESTGAWMPYLEFLGLGLIFCSLAFVLLNVLSGIKETYPSKESIFNAKSIDYSAISEKIYPWLLIAGLIILLTAFIISIYQAVLASSYWNNSIIAELDPAPAGSEFASQLATMETIRAILQPVRFLGLGAVISSVVLVAFALHRAIRAETLALVEVAESQSKLAA